MAYYAKVVDTKVVQVIIAEPEFFNEFVDTSPGEWIETSNNTIGGIHYNETGVPDDGIALRKNTASVGYTYDKEHDVFIPPQPYKSWILNTQTYLWNAPVSYPSDGKRYIWNEEAQQWDEITNGTT